MDVTALFDEKCRIWIRDGGDAFLCAKVQEGKTQLILRAASMAHKAGFIPLILTQPDLRLREQGHSDALRSGLELGIQTMRGRPLLF